jgi:hypothetical protein
LLAARLGAAEAPFWKSKEKVYARIRSGEVIVSVKEDTPSGSKHRLVMSGGGWVAAPLAFVRDYSSDYAKVAKACPFVTQAKWSAATKRLSVQISAFGHGAHLVLSVEKLKGEEGHGFTIVEGPMHGLEMKISFVQADVKHTEAALSGSYDYERFPIPRLFLEFGMEVILRRTAWRLRHQVETEFRRIK